MRSYSFQKNWPGLFFFIGLCCFFSLLFEKELAAGVPADITKESVDSSPATTAPSITPVESLAPSASVKNEFIGAISLGNDRLEYYLFLGLLVALFHGIEWLYLKKISNTDGTSYLLSEQEWVTFAGSGLILLLLYLFVRFIHGRPFKTLVTTEKNFDWLQIGKYLFFQLLLLIVAHFGLFCFTPSSLQGFTDNTNGTEGLTLESILKKLIKGFKVLLTRVTHNLLASYFLQATKGLKTFFLKIVVGMTPALLIYMLGFYARNGENSEQRNGLSAFIFAAIYLFFTLYATLKTNALYYRLGTTLGVNLLNITSHFIPRLQKLNLTWRIIKVEPFQLVKPETNKAPIFLGCALLFSLDLIYWLLLTYKDSSFKIPATVYDNKELLPSFSNAAV